MHCSPKTMIKAASALGGALLIAYFAFPEAQTLVLASAPILLALICPVMMVVMMFMMRGKPGQPSASAAADGATATQSAAAQAAPHAVRDASVERA